MSATLDPEQEMFAAMRGESAEECMARLEGRYFPRVKYADDPDVAHGRIISVEKVRGYLIDVTVCRKSRFRRSRMSSVLRGPSQAQMSSKLVEEASRAWRDGRVGDALRLNAQAGRQDRVMDCLRQTVPMTWSIRGPLLEVANELSELGRGLEIARTSGGSEDQIEPMNQGVIQASEVLWRTANRLAAVAKQKIEPTALEQGFQREQERLSRLLSATQEARRALAALTLAGGGPEELTQILRSFRRLAETAHAMDELLDHR